jgi:U32 family peptidase
VSRSTMRRRLPELLAPAGDWDCLWAAVENGADAIYFGLERFNARMRAANFRLEELPSLMRHLHVRGVKGYVTFNTLVFTEELEESAEFLRQIIQAGADAAIVQDIGVCRLIRQLSPDFPIHASTQMTITSGAGLRLAQQLGCSLVALARECSLKEIELLNARVEGNVDGAALPLEIFVHGALCVAYSGQCLTSESLGGRSANRGVCAQACRLPYELISDDQLVPLGDRKFLLSPQDLAGLELLPQIIKAGIHTIKIEGRLKSPEYVAIITRIYRQALDALGRLQNERPAEFEKLEVYSIPAPDRYDMEMAFSRGLHTGWLNGINNRHLVHARFSKKRGVYLGEVVRVQHGQVLVRLKRSLKPGDGVVFDSGPAFPSEQGGRIYTVEKEGNCHWLGFGRGTVHLTQVQPGSGLWKTNDPELDRRVKQTMASDQPRYQRPVELLVQGSPGEPLTIEATDECHHSVRVVSSLPLINANKQPLNQGLLEKHLGRLGGTPFSLGALRNQLQGQVILPVSELNRLRREWTIGLIQARSSAVHWTLNEPAVSLPNISSCPSQPAVADARNSPDVSESVKLAQLTVLVRDVAQMEAALESGIRDIYLELEDLRGFRPAIQRGRSLASSRLGSGPDSKDLSPRFWVAPPRITKPGETGLLRTLRDCGADGFLLRNYDHLEFFAGGLGVADYSFNIANPWSADYFMRHYRLARITASYDLNGLQLERLMAAAPPSWFEITIHQHMPMFHMDHCVFCAFLSSGTDHTDCGRPCEKHSVRLRDRVGVEHPVQADAGCRNTVYNGRAQTGAEHVLRLQSAGVRYFRIDFLNESPGLVKKTIDKYSQLLRGEISAAALWRELKLLNFLGVTRGPSDPLSDSRIAATTTK